MKRNVRHIIVSGDIVMRTIAGLTTNGVKDITISNCGWSKDPDKWTMIFQVDKNLWDYITKNFNVIRVWRNEDILANCTGIWSVD